MDRTNQKLVISKDGKMVAESAIGTPSVTITGVEAGSKVASGDYKAAFSDGIKTSELVDVPAFEVEQQLFGYWRDDTKNPILDMSKPYQMASRTEGELFLMFSYDKLNVGDMMTETTTAATSVDTMSVDGEINGSPDLFMRMIQMDKLTIPDDVNEIEVSFKNIRSENYGLMPDVNVTIQLPPVETAKLDFSTMKRQELIAELKARNIKFETTDKNVDLIAKLEK